ncbi:MAG: FIST N-terminal domain-containing protein [Planctomycetota bacterium]
MQFASAASQRNDIGSALDDVLDRLGPQLAPASADLAVVFVSGHHPVEVESLAGPLRKAFPQATIIGCTAESTVVDSREVEFGTSLSVLAGVLPGVTVRPFRLEASDLLDANGDWPVRAGLGGGNGRGSDSAPVIIAVGDPASFPVGQFLARINKDFPGCRVIGGMASAGFGPGENRLLLDGETHDEGLVGITLSGDIRLDTVVSQGCRPVGRHAVITSSQEHVIRELAGRPALELLSEIARAMSPHEQKLLESGLFVGKVINEHKAEFSHGDFLVMNVPAIDPRSGAIAVTGEIRRGQTVQFHVRDAASADEDLRQLLAPHGVASGKPAPAAALLFTCNGRGSRMWETAGHDAGMLQELCGPVPTTGFFAAGELGPVGGQNLIHGFTASIALLRPAQERVG